MQKIVLWLSECFGMTISPVLLDSSCYKIGDYGR